MSIGFGAYGDIQGVNPGYSNRLAGFFGQAPDFGLLAPLEQVTQTKFGQAGVDAIKNYSQLQGAKIASQLYMKEVGAARPATQFTLHKSDDAVIATIDGKETVKVEGVVVYEPGGSDMYMIIGAGVLIIGLVIAALVLKG